MSELRPCLAKHPQPQPATCRICWLAMHDARYQFLWGVPKEAPVLRRYDPTIQFRGKQGEARQALFSPPIQSCRELGQPLNEKEVIEQGIDPAACKSCHNKVRKCAIFGACTTGGNVLPNVKACCSCLEYDIGQPEPVLEPRHLLYHVYPVAGNGHWQWNVGEIMRRLAQFSGKRHVAIVTDLRTDSPEAVKAAFGGERIDKWVIQENNPARREVATWPELWQGIAGEPGISLYAHAKGVTRPFNAGSSIQGWAELMYSALLDHPSLIARMLRRWPIVGAAKKVGMAFGHDAPSKAPWHYTGSFYWVRNDDLGDKWRSIDQHKYGVEPWPGLHWPASEAGWFAVGHIPEMDLYNLQNLARVKKEVEQWILANQEPPSAIG